MHATETVIPLSLAIPTSYPVPAVILTEEGKVEEGQKALERIETSSKMMREDWRLVGEALLIGRKLHKSDKLFGQWCKEKGFAKIKQQVRNDAIWLAENWSTHKSLVGSGDCHPTNIRQAYRDSQSAAAVNDDDELPEPTPTTSYSCISSADLSQIAKLFNQMDNATEMESAIAEEMLVTNFCEKYDMDLNTLRIYVRDAQGKKSSPKSVEVKPEKPTKPFCPPLISTEAEIVEQLPSFIEKRRAMLAYIDKRKESGEEVANDQIKYLDSLLDSGELDMLSLDPSVSIDTYAPINEIPRETGQFTPRPFDVERVSSNIAGLCWSFFLIDDNTISSAKTAAQLKGDSCVQYLKQAADFLNQVAKELEQ